MLRETVKRQSKIRKLLQFKRWEIVINWTVNSKESEL